MQGSLRLLAEDSKNLSIFMRADQTPKMHVQMWPPQLL